MSARVTCLGCARLDTFEPRPDEPSRYGCHAPGWEGYVTNPEKPPCGGVKFIRMPGALAGPIGRLPGGPEQGGAEG